MVEDRKVQPDRSANYMEPAGRNCLACLYMTSMEMSVLETRAMAPTLWSASGILSVLLRRSICVCVFLSIVTFHASRTCSTWVHSIFLHLNQEATMLIKFTS